MKRPSTKLLNFSVDLKVIQFAPLSVVLVGCLILVAGLASRGEALGWFAEHHLQAFLWGQFVYFSILVANMRPRTFCLLAASFTAVAVHAFANIYHPSLRLDTPIQDYLLHDRVSANFSFDNAILYLKNLMFFIPAGVVLGLCWPLVDKFYRYTFFAMVVLAAGLNYFIFCVQGCFGLEFLAAGSGTAVESRRAAGLLEDSGASSVYATTLVVASLTMVVFLATNFRIWWRQFWFAVVFLLVGLATGSLTGGRVFFAAAVVGGAGVLVVTALTMLFVDRSKAYRLTVIAGLGLGCCLAMLYWVGLSQVKIAQTIRTAEIFLFDHHSISRFLSRIARKRAGHYDTMIADFSDHWAFGSGLGTFHANHYQYAENLGIVPLVDNPSNLYLMLLSALGLAGLAILIVIAIWLGMLVRGFVGALARKNAAPNSLDEFLPVVGLGVSLALGVTFIVGIHIVFISVCSLLVFVIAALVNVSERYEYKLVRRLLLGCAIFIPAILFARGVGLVLSAPPAPEFRWQERGKPQVPLSLVVPIKPPDGKGLWLPAGGELLYEGARIAVFAELPPKYYPLTVGISVYDRKHQLKWSDEKKVTRYQLPRPGRLLQFEPPRVLRNECRSASTPTSYCYFKLNTHPIWFRDGQKVGAYVVFEE